MGLQQTISGDLKNAMKAKDKERTGAIRIVLGEFQRQPGKDLTDEQVIGVIKKLIKSERELLEAQGKEESSFITVLEGYLPKQATEEDIRNWIMDNIDFSGFANKMQAMKPIMTHFGSSADGNTVKKILQEMD